VRTVVNAAERFRPAGTPEDLLTVVEVAALMRCGRTKVFALIGDGSLPSVRPGRARLVRRGDVDTYLETLRTT
jgi:excisionase family DNA binding protein